MRYRPATIDQARELEVACVERLRKIVNGHEKIRPFLCEYPFPKEGAKISIRFCDANNQSYPAEKSIQVVYNVRGRVFYENCDEKAEDWETILEEPYEEALLKVQGIL